VEARRIRKIIGREMNLWGSLVPPGLGLLGKSILAESIALPALLPSWLTEPLRAAHPALFL